MIASVRVLLLAAVLMMCVPSNLLSQAFNVTYNFASVASGTGGYTDPTAVPTATGATFQSFTAVPATGNPYSMGANPNASGRFSFAGWPTGATSGSDVFSGSLQTGQYYQVTITPNAGFSLSVSSISFTIQRSGTGIRQYAVRSSADGYSANLPASVSGNANLSVVSGNIFQVSDASTAANAGSSISLSSGHTDVTGPLTFRFYGFNAEGSAGTFSIDNVNIIGSVAAAGSTPVISLSSNLLALPLTNIGATSAALQYTVSGTGLAGNVTVQTAAPFSISTDNVSFGTTASITMFEAAVGKNIYVQFSPTVAGIANGSITHNSAGAVEKTITLNGQGFDPSNLNFNFNSCAVAGEPGSGFTQFSTTGAQVWNCTSFGRSSNGIQMNGFSAGVVENEDWLISPPMDLSVGFNIPVLRFWSRTEFNGPAMQVLISTNYSGSGNPAAATWTVLPANLPGTASNTWTLSDNIDLSAYKNSNVYVAFKYMSTVALGAARWTLDDVQVANVSSYIQASPAAANLGEVSVGSSSAAQAVTLTGKGFGDVTLSMNSGWQLSADNSSFGSSLLVSNASLTAGATVYVRYAPLQKQLRDTGRLKATATGLDSVLAIYFASSYPKTETLDVATWNMTFFGSNSSNTATQPYKETQKQNAKTVIDRLNADVVGVQEISSDSVWNVLLSEMAGYAAVLSPRWSRSFDAPDPNFPPQKVGVLYNAASMTLVSSRAMFESIYDAARSGSNTLPLYPSPQGASAFWASGRLPFMATFNANINGVQRTLHVVVIHAKSGSAAAEDYNRRVYDARVLKDTLDTYYANDAVIIVGDYNDDAINSTFTGQPSPYKPFVDDATSYAALTGGFSAAGKASFVGSGNSMIDHLFVSNEMNSIYLAGSADVEDPRTYVTSYTSTTSDHLPVFARFVLDQPLPATLQPLQGKVQQQTAQLQWRTLQEQNTSHFIVERAAGNSSVFVQVATVKAAGNSSVANQYQFNDGPLPAGNYRYRLRLVDTDGSVQLSNTITLRVQATQGYAIYPNPVQGQLQLQLPAAVQTVQWALRTADGKLLASGKTAAAATQPAIQTAVTGLPTGYYWLQLNEVQLKLVKQ